MAATAILISGDHLGWRGLRAALRTHRHLRIVAETRQPDQAVEVARIEQPDLVLIETDRTGPALLPLVRSLHAACAHTQFLLFGTPRPREEQRELAALGVSASVGWASLVPKALPHVLGAVETGLLVGDRPALERLLDADTTAKDTETAAAARVKERPPLPPMDRAILDHLARGSNVTEIAAIVHLGERQVDRYVRDLKARLGVRTQFALALAAVRYGYLDPAELAPHAPQNDADHDATIHEMPPLPTSRPPLLG